MNQLDLKGRVAIVTGGARGIGYATAERMLTSGAEVSLWDIDSNALEPASRALSERGKVTTEQVELTDEASVDRATRSVVEKHGKIDILVKNAGITGGNGKLWELTPEVWRRVIEVNLIGPDLTCRAVVPEMLKNGWGRIVNVASIAGKEGNPNASHYSSSKAGLIGLTKSLGKELATSTIATRPIWPSVARGDRSLGQPPTAQPAWRDAAAAPGGASRPSG